MDRRCAPLPARAAWDRDLDVPLEEAQWNRVCAHMKTISSNFGLKLIHFNYIHRAYVTPVPQHRMDRSRPTACPRCQHPLATFLHLAWSCPEVLVFWIGVIERVRTVANLPELLDPVFCLLGDIPRKKGLRISYKFLQLLFLLAKRRVAITWMAVVAPSLNRWIGDVLEWAVGADVRMKLY